MGAISSSIGSVTSNKSNMDESLNASSPHSTRDFSYEEFDGNDGKTCPTCRGTGRIPKRQGEELVALIPYHDKRLEPRRTKLYVAVAIIICLIVCGLILFFILPRSVEVTEGMILNYTVVIDKNASSTEITLINQFNVSNSNYFHIEIAKFNVEAYFDRIQVGVGDLHPVPVLVPPRTTGFAVRITMKLQFNKSNQLDYVAKICTNDLRHVHDIVIKFQATQTSKYLQHSEQNLLTVYKYIDCSPDRHH